MKHDDSSLPPWAADSTFFAMAENLGYRRPSFFDVFLSVVSAPREDRIMSDDALSIRFLTLVTSLIFAWALAAGPMGAGLAFFVFFLFFPLFYTLVVGRRASAKSGWILGFWTLWPFLTLLIVFQI